MQRTFFDDFETKLKAEYELVQEYAEQPQLDLTATLDAAALKCGYFKKMLIAFEDIKKSLNDKDKNTERIQGMIVAYEAYFFLIQHFLSEQFLQETLADLQLEQNKKYTFEQRIQIYQRLNKHLDFLNPVINKFHDLFSKIKSGKRTFDQVNSLMSAMYKAEEKLEKENAAIAAADSKATKCISFGVALFALSGLGLVAEAALCILVIASVITLTAACPWLVLGGVLGLFFLIGVAAKGLRLFEVAMPEQQYDHEALQPIKIINEYFFGLFAYKAPLKNESDISSEFKSVLS